MKNCSFIKVMETVHGIIPVLTVNKGEMIVVKEGLIMKDLETLA